MVLEVLILPLAGEEYKPPRRGVTKHDPMSQEQMDTEKNQTVWLEVLGP